MSFPKEIEVSYKNGTTVKFDCKDELEYFRARAAYEQTHTNVVFKKGDKISTDYTFSVRVDEEDNEYFEYICTSTDPELRGAKIALGQYKEKGKGLFMKYGGRATKWVYDLKKEVFLEFWDKQFGPKDYKENGEKYPYDNKSSGKKPSSEGGAKKSSKSNDEGAPF